MGNVVDWKALRASDSDFPDLTSPLVLAKNCPTVVTLDADGDREQGFAGLVAIQFLSSGVADGGQPFTAGVDEGIAPLTFQVLASHHSVAVVVVILKVRFGVVHVPSEKFSIG